MLLQISVVGEPAVTLHCVPVPSTRQTTEPMRAHAPTPAVQALPRPEKVSSTAPLQLSSRVLQVSVEGSTSPGQLVPQLPAAQVCVPARQTPTPLVPVAPV